MTTPLYAQTPSRLAAAVAGRTRSTCWNRHLQPQLRPGCLLSQLLLGVRCLPAARADRSTCWDCVRHAHCSNGGKWAGKTLKPRRPSRTACARRRRSDPGSGANGHHAPLSVAGATAICVFREGLRGRCRRHCAAVTRDLESREPCQWRSGGLTPALCFGVSLEDPGNVDSQQRLPSLYVISCGSIGS
jgi:hypothetical protein